MKNTLRALVLTFVAAIAAMPATAQGVPQGSYVRSCTDIDIRANTLTATCRRAGGGPLRTALAGAHQCIGDIGNNNGVLQCNFPGGAVARGQVVQAPPGPPPVAAPPYGGRGPQRWERCRELERRAEDLRAKRDWAWYPDERARYDRRLHEVRNEMREMRCR